MDDIASILFFVNFQKQLLVNMGALLTLLTFSHPHAIIVNNKIACMFEASSKLLNIL